MIDKNTKQINLAASDAVKVISEAAKAATAAIASAAVDASKLLASNAQEAAKVANIKDGNDHDLLVELKTKIEGIKVDIKELSDGTASRITTLENEKLNIRDSYPMLYKAGVEKCIQDHEERIRINTNKITQIMTWGSAAVLLLGVVEFLLNKFL